MNYLQDYIDLINYCLNDDRYIGDGNLYQKHHIFPRSLYPALKNKKWNIVLLTPSEHKKAHLLLTKITIGECNKTMLRSYNQYFNW